MKFSPKSLLSSFQSYPLYTEWASDCRQTQENTYIPPTDAPPEEKAET